MKTLEKRFENISLCVSTEKDGESVRERVMVKSVRSRQSKIKTKHSSGSSFSPVLLAPRCYASYTYVCFWGHFTRLYVQVLNATVLLDDVFFSA